jgi:tetratricopeptide (TPR) repeat protein
VKDLSRAIDLAPLPRWRSFDSRGRAYYRLGKLERAVDDRTAAMQTGEALEPKDLFPLYYNRGIAYQGLKEYARAEADFAKAASLKPDDPTPHEHRAVVLDGLNRKREADKERDKAAELRRRTSTGSK